MCSCFWILFDLTVLDNDTYVEWSGKVEKDSWAIFTHCNIMQHLLQQLLFSRAWHFWASCSRLSWDQKGHLGTVSVKWEYQILKGYRYNIYIFTVERSYSSIMSCNMEVLVNIFFRACMLVAMCGAVMTGNVSGFESGGLFSSLRTHRNQTVWAAPPPAHPKLTAQGLQVCFTSDNVL